MPRLTALSTLLLALLAAPAESQSAPRYLIYVPGRIIEEQQVRRPTDARFGVYEYDGILDGLRQAGLVVLSDMRPPKANSDSAAGRVAGQVDSLLLRGVRPQDITVVGFSKGGWIAILSSARLQNPAVSFVFMGACGPWAFGPDLHVSGRMLSLYEASDSLGVSCAPMFAHRSPGGSAEEIALAAGLGHGTFFQPRADWLTPVIAWAGGGPATRGFTIPSAALGEARLVNVHTPPGYDALPAARYPVLYMPDGGLDEDFPHVVATVDSLIAAGSIRPVIVVGIPNTQRRRDLTGPTRIASDSAIAPRVGRSAAFRQFLGSELMPAVEARYRTTDERAIIGESLAGLFVVETFLLEPALFDHYVALDPSLWWNGGALVDSAPTRLAAFDAGSRTLYLASSNVGEIATATARIEGSIRAQPPAGLTWVYAPRPDLTHATIFRGVEAAALAAALR